MNFYGNGKKFEQQQSLEKTLWHICGSSKKKSFAKREKEIQSQSYSVCCSDYIEHLVNQQMNIRNTLPADMFGVREFWLETRVIIKISTHPC